MKKLYILLLSCGLVYSACSQQKYSDEVEEQIKQVENNLGNRVRIDGKGDNIIDRMAYYKVKGLSIAVIHNYKVVWAKGYGWADEKEKRPITTETLFEPGSISKSLNAVAILKLVQDKKLDLYTDINTYLKSWKFPYDKKSNGKKITLAQLLSHSAGLTVHGFPGYDRKEKIPTVPQILDGKKPANTPSVRSMIEPGEKFIYSGGGTTISQLIITDVTGQPYDKFLYENVLKPIGMENSFYSQPPPENKWKLCATGYYPNGDEVPNKFHVYPEQGAAGLWMTPTDLCNYIIETQLAYEGKSAKVLNQEMTKLRLTPYNDKAAALGVFVNELDGVKYFDHGAGNEGFKGQYYGSLEDGNGVAVFINSDNFGVVPELINSVAYVYKWKGFYKPVSKGVVTVPDSILKKYIGVYSMRENTFVSIVMNEDGLYQYADGQLSKMYFISPTDYFNPEIDSEKSFRKDATGNITGYQRKFRGEEMFAKKLTHPDSINGDARLCVDLGWHLLENKNYEWALGLFKRVKKMEPKELMTDCNMAHCYLFSGNYDKAIKLYKENLDKDVQENRSFKSVIFEDFIYFKQKGFDKTVMDKVVAELKLQMPQGY